jgi:hypothetical protein
LSYHKTNGRTANLPVNFFQWRRLPVKQWQCQSSENQDTPQRLNEVGRTSATSRDAGLLKTFDFSNWLA